MTSATPFDFSKARGLGSRIESRLSNWCRFFCKGAPERLARVLGMPPTLAPGEIEQLQFQQVVARWTAPMVGCRIAVAGTEPCTLLIIPETMARILISLMLGVPIEQPEESVGPLEQQPLTGVEQGLIELLVGELVAAWIESWPEEDPPGLQALNIENNPAKSRLVPMSTEITRFAFSLTVEDQSAELEWLLPSPIPLAIVGEEEIPTPSPQDRERLENLVREMPVEVVVRLGQANLHVRDLARLKSGDVILLDRKTAQPLEAVIDSSSRFLGWAGRIGSQQAYQIASLMGGAGDD